MYQNFEVWGEASRLQKKEVILQKEITFVVTESLDGGYEAKALGHSIYTDAHTQKELALNVRDAVICHFDGDDMPSIIRLQFVRDEILAI